MAICRYAVFLVYDKLQNERYKYFKKYGFNDAKGLTLSLIPCIFVFNGSLSLTIDKYNSIVHQPDKKIWILFNSGVDRALKKTLCQMNNLLTIREI